MTGWDAETNTYYINDEATSLNSNGYGDYNNLHYSAYPTLYQGYDVGVDQYYVNGQAVEKVYGCTNPSAYNYNPLANMNTGCVSTAQLPKYFLPDLSEWFKSAYYDSSKTSENKYWKYAFKNDEKKSCVIANKVGDGIVINCEDYGTCRPISPNDICGCFNTWKTNNTIYLDPQLNADYDKDIVEFNYTGPGCDISNLLLTYRQKVGPQISNTSTTLPSIGLKLNSSGSGPIIVDMSGISEIGNKLIHFSGTNTGMNLVRLVQNYDLLSNGDVSVLKTGSGAWYLGRPMEWYLSRNKDVVVNVYSGVNFIREGTIVGTVSTAQGGAGGSFGAGSTIIRIGNTTETSVDFVAILLAPGVELGRTLFVEPPVINSPQKVILGSTTDMFSIYNTLPLPPSVISGSIRLSRDVTLQAATGTKLQLSATLTQPNGAGTPSVNYTIGSDNNYGIVNIIGSGSIRTTGTITIYAGTLKMNYALPTSPSTITVGLPSSTNAILDFSPLSSSFSLTNSQTLKGNGLIILNNNVNFTINGIFNPSMVTLSGNATTKTVGTTKIDINGSSRGVGGYGAVDVSNNGKLDFSNGTLQLNFNSEIANSSILELFKVNNSSTLIGNFNSLVVGGTASLSSVTASKGVDGIWTSTTSSNNQYFTFNPSTGVLNILSSIN